MMLHNDTECNALLADRSHCDDRTSGDSQLEIQSLSVRFGVQPIPRDDVTVTHDL